MPAAVSIDEWHTPLGVSQGAPVSMIKRFKRSGFGCNGSSNLNSGCCSSGTGCRQFARRHAVCGCFSPQLLHCDLASIFGIRGATAAATAPAAATAEDQQQPQDADGRRLRGLGKNSSRHCFFQPQQLLCWSACCIGSSEHVVEIRALSAALAALPNAAPRHAHALQPRHYCGRGMRLPKSKPEHRLLGES